MKKMTVGFVLTATLSVSLSAAVLVYEGFDYSAGALPGSNGGTGWSSDWGINGSSGSINPGGDGQVESPAQLTAPSDYALTPIGNSAEFDSVGGYRQFNANAIDMSQNDTFYFSYLWSQSGTGSGGNISVAFLDNATNSRRIWETQTASQSLTMDFGNDASAAAGSLGFTAGTSYLMVGKVETTTGADTISISIFEAGTAIGAEPVTWGLSGNVEVSDQDRVINRLRIIGTGNNDRFDEFYLGDTFEDVTGVIPEPSTVMLVGIALLGGLMARLRRS